MLKIKGYFKFRTIHKLTARHKDIILNAANAKADNTEDSPAKVKDCDDQRSIRNIY